MEPGHTRAASFMNAALRSRFAERIQKYEAKVRQGKGLIKEPRDVIEKKNHFGKDEQQQSPLAEKMMVPEKVLPREVGYGENVARQHYEREHSQKKVHNEQEECLHERGLHNLEKGFLSDKDTYKRQGRDNSPELHRVFSEQKEMISGMLQRSSSLSSSRLNNFDVVDMATGVLPMSTASGNFLPMEMMHLQLQDRIYEEVKPPSRLRINIEAIACELRVRLKAADMPLPMQEHAFRCARECLDNIGKGQSKLIAHALKKEFDDDYGPAWHCIVGTSFGSFVTHSLGGFVYFSLDKVSVLLFKTTVEPLENSR